MHDDDDKCLQILVEKSEGKREFGRYFGVDRGQCDNGS
jgi:hypothetical protein